MITPSSYSTEKQLEKYILICPKKEKKELHSELTGL